VAKAAKKKPEKKTVARYADALGDWRRRTVKQLTKILRAADPSLIELIKWGQPVYSGDHGPVCYVKAFPSQVHCGFWWGKKLKDPGKRLLGDGEKMAHLKFVEGDEISEEVVARFLREAATLNEKHGDPTRR